MKHGWRKSKCRSTLQLLRPKYAYLCCAVLCSAVLSLCSSAQHSLCVMLPVYMQRPSRRWQVAPWGMRARAYPHIGVCVCVCVCVALVCVCVCVCMCGIACFTSSRDLHDRAQCCGISSRGLTTHPTHTTHTAHAWYAWLGRATKM